MRLLLREIRDLIRGPEFLAILLICLLLGRGGPVHVWVVQAPRWLEDTSGRLLTVCPGAEVFEALRRILPVPQ